MVKERISEEGFAVRIFTEKGRKQKITVIDLSKVNPFEPPPSIEKVQELLRAVQEASRNPRLGRTRY